MRTATITGCTLITIIVIGMLSGWFYLRHGLPNTDDSLVIEGLDADVTVMRDDKGVPRIFAATDRDAFFTMGYLHAQDRLWQLELQRRVGSGRLSEIFGETTLSSDKFIRTMGFYDSAASIWHTLSEPAKDSLTAYTAGINQWLDEDRTLPPEFLILGLFPERWAVEDSLVWMKMVGFNLSRNYTTERTRSRLLQRTGKKRAAKLMQSEPDRDPPVTLETALSHPAAAGLTTAFSISDIPLINGQFGGSNAWVIAGEHTQSGLPILANDPHLETQNPSVWYLAEIQGDRLHATGATLVGLPIVIVGRNDYVAWGMTTSGVDVQDLYMERINDKDQYEYDGAWKDMVVDEAPIVVSGRNKPVRWKARRTKHGPLISDIDTRQPTPVSIRWAGLEPGDTTYDSHFRLNYSKSVYEFRNILRDYTGIGIHFLYADREGNIASKFTGHVPIRKTGDGSLPVPGWNGDYEWTGWIPFEDMPEKLNPEIGYLISANEQVVPEIRSQLLTRDWSPPYRAQRIAELISDLIDSGNSLTVSDMKIIQGDTVNIPSRELLPFLLQLVAPDERQAKAIGYLRKWDNDTTRDSIATSIYEVWVNRLATRILEDEFDSQSVANILRRYPSVFILDIMSKGDHSWCDDIRTRPPESCPDMMRLSLDDALDKLTELVGGNMSTWNDMSTWNWGALHKTQYNHTPFSSVPILRSIFHREIASNGSRFTVNHGYPDYSDEYAHTWGAGYRQIIDFGESSADLFIIAPGQSGNPLSKHYDDLVEPHRNLNYLTMSFGADNATGTPQRLVSAPQ